MDRSLQHLHLNRKYDFWNMGRKKDTYSIHEELVERKVAF